MKIHWVDIRWAHSVEFDGFRRDKIDDLEFFRLGKAEWCEALD